MTKHIHLLLKGGFYAGALHTDLRRSPCGASIAHTLQPRAGSARLPNQAPGPRGSVRAPASMEHEVGAPAPNRGGPSAQLCLEQHEKLVYASLVQVMHGRPCIRAPFPPPRMMSCTVVMTRGGPPGARPLRSRPWRHPGGCRALPSRPAAPLAHPARRGWERPRPRTQW